jgi:hypothetical protein
MKITVKTPATNPRIIIESEHGKVMLRPVELPATGVLLVNAFLQEGDAEIDIHDER